MLDPGPVVRTSTPTAPLSLAAGVTDHHAVTVTLPSAAGDAFRPQASDLEVVLTAVQRNGTAR